jgi:hypothetical protein
MPTGKLSPETAKPLLRRSTTPVLRARSPESHRGNTALLVEGISPPGAASSGVAQWFSAQPAFWTYSN